MTSSPSSSPNLLDLLTRPREFFTALRILPASNGRYVWLVLLTGLISGLFGALSQKPIQDAMSGMPMMGGAVTMVFGVVTTVVVSLLMWLMLWGLGSLGAGKEGRSAEVFAASFLPSLVISLVLLPLVALFPLQVHVAAPNMNGLEGAELGKAMQKYSLALQKDVGSQPISIIGKVLTYGAMAWQFYLAWVGFNVLTADRQKALKGTLIPLAVMLLLGGAFWLLGRAMTGLMGGGA